MDLKPYERLGTLADLQAGDWIDTLTLVNRNPRGKNSRYKIQARLVSIEGNKITFQDAGKPVGTFLVPNCATQVVYRPAGV